jgi:hypothetical protein
MRQESMRMLLAAGTLAAAVLLSAPITASAAGRIPTSTKVTSSSSTVLSTRAVKLTVTVSRSRTYEPKAGHVTLVDLTTGENLAAVNADRPCHQRTACQRQALVTGATIRGSQLAVGPNEIEAIYSGSAHYAPSSATVTVTMIWVAVCTAADYQGCNTNQINSGDGNYSLQITTDPPTDTETFDITFQSQPLICTSPGTGDPAAWTATGVPAGQDKSITYQVFGNSAVNVLERYGSTSYNPDNLIGSHVCFESDDPFTTVSSQTSLKGPDGYYYGILPLCNMGDTNVPCVLSTNFYYGDTTSGDVYIDNLLVPASDPRVSN